MVQAGSGRRRTTRKPTSQLRSRASRRRRWARAGAARERAAPVVVRQPTATGGLALTQLLDFARLTPAQAVALGADVLSGLHERSVSGPTPVGLGPESVRVASDGRAHLIDPPGARNGRDGAPDLAAAGALLGELMAATHASDAAETAAGPLAALGRAAAEARRPDGTVATVASILGEADATTGAAARAELARLISAVRGGRLAAPRRAPSTPRPVTPRPHRPPRAVARTVVARTWKWVLSIVVLTTVILIEVAFLRHEIARDVQAVLDAGRSGPTASGIPALPPVVPPAPTSAGPVTAVNLRGVEACTPGQSCAVRVQVVLQPRPEPQTVTWAFTVVDRCTGETTTAPGGTVTVPLGGDRADAVGTVAVPPGDALAVLVLTSAPATAASSALPVPADGACGPHPSGPPG
jgi:hypothetical protein